MNHLNKEISLVALAGADERINRIQAGKWIGYSKIREIHQAMEYLLIHPQIARMPCQLIISSSGNGKTHCLQKFCDAHKPIRTDQGMQIPVLYVQAPFKPDEKMFYINILQALNAPCLIRGTSNQLYQQVRRILIQVKTRILIIDEIHHVVAGGHLTQRVFLNMIKYITNDLQIVIIASGIQDALSAIGSDPQLANRFEPAIIPRWTMNEDYLRLLSSFEAILPLRKPSNLTSEEKAMKILSLSGGTIGAISAILKKAAIQAIITKKECIDIQLLASVHTVPASDKKEYESVLI